jgi:iron donor protein CyaY
MTDSEYHQLADAVFKRVEETVDGAETVIDCDRKGGSVLELSFENGSQIIVNKQAPMQEIWVAAKAGGFHYGWKDGAWRSARDGSELLADLSRFISEQAGETVTF